MFAEFIPFRGRTRMLSSIICLMLVLPAFCAADGDETFVRMKTDAGDILLVMSPETAPNHVANFLHLGSTGFYDGAKFHRVIPGFMIQGGDPNSKDDNTADDGTGGPEWSDVLTADEMDRLNRVKEMLESKGYVGFGDTAMLKQEFNETEHVRGTLSMARSRSVDSAGSQFFICVARAANLDHKYTAFGQVVSGMDVVDAIVSAPRNRSDYPDTPVSITAFEVIEGVSGLDQAERDAWQQLQGETAMEESRP